MSTLDTLPSEGSITDYSQTKGGLPAPADWHVDEVFVDGTWRWERLFGERITVVEDVQVKADGRRWLHVSVAKAKPTKRPSYDDLQEARRLFIGIDRECYEVWPPKNRYVNMDEVLHLWCCLDAPEGVLPHFEQFDQKLGHMTI